VDLQQLCRNPGRAVHGMLELRNDEAVTKGPYWNLGAFLEERVDFRLQFL